MSTACTTHVPSTPYDTFVPNFAHGDAGESAWARAQADLHVGAGIALFMLMLRYANCRPFFELAKTETLVEPRVAYVFAMMAVLVVGFVLSGRRPGIEKVRSSGVSAMAACAALLGSSAVLYGAGTLLPAVAMVALEVVIALAFAFLFVYLLFGWVDALLLVTGGEARTALVVLAGSCALSFVIALFAYAVVGESPLVLAVAVPASCVLLQMWRRRKNADGTLPEPVRVAYADDGHSTALFTGIVVLFFMLALSISGSISAAALGLDVGDEPYLRHLVTVVEMLAVVAIALFVGNSHKMMYSVWIVLSLLFVAGLLMMRSADRTVLALGFGLASAGRSCFEVLLLTMLMRRPAARLTPRVIVALFLLPETSSIVLGRLVLPSLYGAMGLVSEEYMGVLTVALPLVLVSIVIAALAYELFRLYDESLALSAGIAEMGAQAVGDECAPSDGPSDDEGIARGAVLMERYGLTRKESEVACLLAQGFSAADIAEAKVLSVNTVRTHAKSAYRKMGVHSRQELADAIAAEV